MHSYGKRKFALVTGGNKGIGLAICRGLLAQGFEVILAARSLDRAKQAANQLKSSQIRLVQMDVTDDESIRQTAEYLSQEIEHLDVLVNNAGVALDQGQDILTISRGQLEQTLNTNTLGPIRVAQAFLPLLKQSDQARVINVSSGCGALSGLSNQASSYSLSKLALNGATLLMANALQPNNIAVYTMCPGWCRTDLGGLCAPRSPEQGADTVIWLATQASLRLSGKFFRDRHSLSYSSNWYDSQWYKQFRAFKWRVEGKLSALLRKGWYKQKPGLR